MTSLSDDREDECANCYHGASFHRYEVPANGVTIEVCDAPGCDCDEFVQPEYDDE